MTQLENLKMLKAQVESAIAYIEGGLPVKEMTPEEKRKWQRGMFHYDFIIGDFGITKISGCKTCSPK